MKANPKIKILIGVPTEKYLENKRDTFTKLKETIQKRIKELE